MSKAPKIGSSEIFCNILRKSIAAAFVFYYDDTIISDTIIMMMIFRYFTEVPVMFVVTCFCVVVVRNGCAILNYRTLKSTVSQHWIDEMSSFFAC